MNLFGETAGDDEALDPMTPPPNRVAGEFFSNPDSSLGGLDLNSQAERFPDFKSYSDILTSPAFPNINEVESAARRRPPRPPRPAKGGCGGAARGADSPSMAANPFRIPRMVGGVTMGGRVTPPGATAAATSSSTPTVVPAASRSVVPPRLGLAAGGSGGPRFSPEVEGSSMPWLAEEEGEGDDQEEGFGHELQEGRYDKANWSPANTSVFCDICVEEIRAGNRINGHFTSRAYKNMIDKYRLRTGLRHSRLQFKNRLQILKDLYTFWLWLNKQSGCGRANGTVVADDEFWKTHTKGHPERKRLRKGPPAFLHQLEEIFDNIAVDGSSSCIPGEHISEEPHQKAKDNAGDGCDGSPRKTTTGKRGNSTKSCATSPRKKSKSPMVKIMKGILDNMESNSAVAKKVLQGELMSESIKKAMQLAVDSGATEGSVEHFMATQLFSKAENREIFFTFTTNEGRLGWLRRWCQLKKMY